MLGEYELILLLYDPSDAVNKKQSQHLQKGLKIVSYIIILSSNNIKCVSESMQRQKGKK